MVVTVKTTWLCDICKDYRNKGSAVKCGSCGAVRKKARHVVVLNGEYYLCHIYTLKHTQLMSVMKTDSIPQKVWKVAYPSDADLNFEIVVAMAKRALDPLPPLTATATKNISTSDAQSIVAQEGSLFDRVMKEGTQIAYDSSIGRFVPIETVEARRSSVVAKKKGKGVGAAAIADAVNTDLHYVKFMAQEKRVMKKVVEETIILRNNQQNEEYEVPNFDKVERGECTLCELALPATSLMGHISFNTVARWREEHSAPLPPSDHRFNANSVYDETPLCLFCTQFFDGDIGSAIEIGCEELKRHRHHIPQKNHVFSEDTTQARPLSSIGRSVDITRLKMKAQRSVGPPLSIGASSSISVLEVKAKTAASIHRINSDLHLYKLKEDRILQDMYKKKRKENRGLSLEDFKQQLFTSAAEAIKDSPVSPGTNIASPNPKIEKKQNAVNDLNVIVSPVTKRRMSLPEIFLEAAQNPNFRLLADARLLVKGPVDANPKSVETNKPRGQAPAVAYNPIDDFKPSSIAINISKSAKTSKRNKDTLYERNKKKNTKEEAPVNIAPSTQSEIPDLKSVIPDADVKNAWAQLLSKTPQSSSSPDAIHNVDDSDPFSVPKLPPISSIRPKAALSPHRAGRKPVSSVNSVTKKTSIVPIKPPQSNQGNVINHSRTMNKEESSDNRGANMAPEWVNSTHANDIFIPKAKLKQRILSLPENQAKVEEKVPKQKSAKIDRKRTASKSKNKKLSPARSNPKVRAIVKDAANVYLDSDEKKTTLKRLGFPVKSSTTSRNKSGGFVSKESTASEKESGLDVNKEESSKTRRVTFSDHSEDPVVAADLQQSQSIPRPVQRGGSGISILKTLRGSNALNGSDEQDPDILISRPLGEQRSVSFEENMYNEDFEDGSSVATGHDSFNEGYALDGFEPSEDDYQLDFEPTSLKPPEEERSPVPVGFPLWDELPVSSHSRKRTTGERAAHNKSPASITISYIKDDFEPLEVTPDADDQSYLNEKFDSPEHEYRSSSGQLFESSILSRPSTSRRGSRGEFSNAMEQIGPRLYSPPKKPTSRRKRRNGPLSERNGMSSPLYGSRPSSVEGAMSPLSRTQSPGIVQSIPFPQYPHKGKAISDQMEVKRQPSIKFIRTDKVSISMDFGTGNVELETAMQDYVDMLFSGEGVEELDIEDNTPSKLLKIRSSSQLPTFVAPPTIEEINENASHMKNSDVDLTVEVVPEPTVASPKKYRAILPREVIVFSNQNALSPDEERSKSEIFEAGKTTRSGAVLSKISHEIKGYPSQLDLTIMRRSGEIVKKPDDKVHEDDAVMAAVAKRLKMITNSPGAKSSPIKGIKK